MAFFSPAPGLPTSSAMLHSPAAFLPSPLDLASPRGKSEASPGFALQYGLLSETPCKANGAEDTLAMMDAEASNGPSKHLPTGALHTTPGATPWASMLAQGSIESVALDQHQLSQGMLCRAASAPPESGGQPAQTRAERFNLSAFVRQHTANADPATGPAAGPASPHSAGEQGPTAKRARLSPRYGAAAPAPAPAPAFARQQSGKYEQMHALEGRVQRLDCLSAQIRRAANDAEAEVVALLHDNAQLWSALAHVATAMRAGQTAARAEAARAAAALFSPEGDDLHNALKMLVSPAPPAAAKLDQGGTNNNANANKPARKLFGNADATPACGAREVLVGDAFMSPDPLAMVHFY